MEKEDPEQEKDKTTGKESSSGTSTDSNTSGSEDESSSSTSTGSNSSSSEGTSCESEDSTQETAYDNSCTNEELRKLFMAKKSEKEREEEKRKVRIESECVKNKSEVVPVNLQSPQMDLAEFHKRAKALELLANPKTPEAVDNIKGDQSSRVLDHETSNIHKSDSNVEDILHDKDVPDLTESITKSLVNHSPKLGRGGADSVSFGTRDLQDSLQELNQADLAALLPDVHTSSLNSSQLLSFDSTETSSHIPPITVEEREGKQYQDVEQLVSATLEAMSEIKQPMLTGSLMTSCSSFALSSTQDKSVKISTKKKKVPTATLR